MAPPRIRVPAGMALVEDGLGGWEIVGEREPLAKTVAWRVPVSDYASLLVFVESFPEKSFSTAMRWLMRHPAVQQVMIDKVTAATTKAHTKKPGPPREEPGLSVTGAGSPPKD